MRRAVGWPLGLGLAVGLSFVGVQAVQAGPPLICHPFDIGQAQSLPWVSKDNMSVGKTDYPLERLVGDTLGLLAPATPVVVRMETMRRAAIYAQRDGHVADELVSKLMIRALEAESRDKPDALAWFDVGYLAETMRQASYFRKPPAAEPATALGIEGYPLVLKAIRTRGADPEMEFAASLMASGPLRAQQKQHLEKALAGASDGTPLGKNLLSYFGEKSKTIAELKTQVAAR